MPTGSIAIGLSGVVKIVEIHNLDGLRQMIRDIPKIDDDILLIIEQKIPQFKPIIA
ncbi:MAG: hypothetical protein PHT88_00800 [Candidatus Moranbacteria bacterium]|nr:hypothetical protein [Candidatus Moranbacteria bacterium]